MTHVKAVPIFERSLRTPSKAPIINLFLLSGQTRAVFVFTACTFANAIHTSHLDVNRLRERMHLPKLATTSRVPPAAGHLRSILRAFPTSRGAALALNAITHTAPPTAPTLVLLLCRWFSVILSVTGRDCQALSGPNDSRTQVG